MNVLKHHKVIEGNIGKTSKDSGLFAADGMAPVLTTHGGFIEHHVELNEHVQAGQKWLLREIHSGKSSLNIPRPWQARSVPGVPTPHASRARRSSSSCLIAQPPPEPVVWPNRRNKPATDESMNMKVRHFLQIALVAASFGVPHGASAQDKTESERNLEAFPAAPSGSYRYVIHLPRLRRNRMPKSRLSQDATQRWTAISAGSAEV